MLNLPSRPRRNRRNETIRAWHRETWLAPQHLVYPVFIHDKKTVEPIASMPGQSRMGLSDLKKKVEECISLGVNSIVLFPAVPESDKSSKGQASYDPEGIVPRFIRALKKEFPELIICTDVALDPYSSDGHDGIVENGIILNDETVEVLCMQAMMQADAGADVIAPSDMMDGRIGAIRDALDEAGHTEVLLLSYTAKYASCYYGPFRDALESAPKFGDKKTYQMDPANAREAIREAEMDEAEGADIMMVKPAGPYLDIIRDLREETNLPIAAYQVSGEYAMIEAAAEKGWLDRDKVILESLTAIRRAGSDIIFTYYAPYAAKLLKK